MTVMVRLIRASPFAQRNRARQMIDSQIAWSCSKHAEEVYFLNREEADLVREPPCDCQKAFHA